MSAFSENVSTLRHERGLSQDAVAQILQVSRITYIGIEAGRVTPKPDIITALAGALRVQPQELFEERRHLSSVRFRSTTQLKSRDMVLAQVGRWLQGYLEIEQLLEEKPKLGLPKRTFAGGIAGARAAAAAMRQHMDISTQEPILNIGGLLEERLGIRLHLLPVATEGFFGLSVSRKDGGPAIVVNNWERISVERWIFSAAHELGHLVLHLNAYDVQEAGEEEQQETEANVFAAQFLMPDAQFAKEWAYAAGLPLVERVFRLKRIFKVSYQTVLKRVSDEVPDIWPRFLAEHKRRTGRPLPRTEEPRALNHQAFCTSLVAEEPQHLTQADLMETRLKSLVRQALDQHKISLSRAAEILNLDLLKMRELADMWVA